MSKSQSFTNANFFFDPCSRQTKQGAHQELQRSLNSVDHLPNRQSPNALMNFGQFFGGSSSPSRQQRRPPQKSHSLSALDSDCMMQQ